MDEVTCLAGLIGAALVGVLVAIGVLVRSGRVIPFTTSSAAWWAGRR